MTPNSKICIKSIFSKIFVAKQQWLVTKPMQQFFIFFFLFSDSKFHKLSDNIYSFIDFYQTKKTLLSIISTYVLKRVKTKNNPGIQRANSLKLIWRDGRLIYGSRYSIKRSLTEIVTQSVINNSIWPQIHQSSWPRTLDTFW